MGPKKANEPVVSRRTRGRSATATPEKTPSTTSGRGRGRGRGRGKVAQPVEELPPPEETPSATPKVTSRSQAEYNKLMHDDECPEPPPTKKQKVWTSDSSESSEDEDDVPKQQQTRPPIKRPPSTAHEEESFLKIERERLIKKGASLYDPYSPYNKVKPTSTPKSKTPGSASKKKTSRTPKSAAAADADDSDVSPSRIPRDDFPDFKVDDYFRSGGRKELALCELWEQFPALYNTEAVGYEKKDTRMAALRKIAFKLQVPICHIKKKMKSLRDDYNKLLAPYIKSGSEAPEGKTERQKELLKMCSFLQPHLRKLQGKPIESYRRKREEDVDEADADADADAGEASQSFFQGEDWPGVGTYKKSDGSVFNARKVVEEEARARHAAELKQDPTYVPEESDDGSVKGKGKGKGRPGINRKLLYKNYDPSLPLTEDELTSNFGEDKKQASYATSRDKLKLMQERTTLMSKMFDQLKAPPPAAPAAAASDDALGEDGVWARALIQKMSRMTIELKTDFKDYVDGIATKAARGKWVPDDE